MSRLNAPGPNRLHPIRGRIRAIASHGSQLLIACAHEEGQILPLYRLDMVTDQLDELGLERLVAGDDSRRCPLLVRGDTAFLALRNEDRTGALVSISLKGKFGKVSAFGPETAEAAGALAPLSDDRLAVLVGAEVLILDSKGKEQDRLELPGVGTALAATPDGTRLAAGTDKGELAVFEAEEQPNFLPSDTTKAHGGAVTALLFEAEAHRLISAGADGRLLQMHARGRLDPEDRGGKGNHDAPIRRLLPNGEVFLSTAGDSAIKFWPTGLNSRRPQTLSREVSTAIDLAVTALDDGESALVAATAGDLRLWALGEDGRLKPDAAGRPAGRIARVQGAIAKASAALDDESPKTREQALKELASWNDRDSIELLRSTVFNDGDIGLRVLATKLLGQTGHRDAVPALERAFHSDDKAVRLEALAGLRALQGMDSTKPMALALEAAEVDLGVAAVEALTGLAAKSEQAYDLIRAGLDSAGAEVREAAFAAMEACHKSEPLEGLLRILRAERADVRRRALERMHEAGLSMEPAARSAIRRAAEDSDADVRQTAFHVSLLARPKLAEALRERDGELHRRLFEIEQPGSKAAPPKRPKTPKIKPESLSAEDRGPLLDAMAGRALDTCLTGASALARLGDVRALGCLLQLSRESDADTRVAVCQALRELGDPRALMRLRLMIRDDDGSVRDAAFSALAAIESERPLDVAATGLGAEHEDIHRRGLNVLVKTLKADQTTKKGKLSKGDGERARELLMKALNDRFPGLRSEAFKATLSLDIGGGPGETLRVALGSVHEDIRREVFVETSAQKREDFAWPLLLDMLADPAPRLRNEVFSFALKQARGKKVVELIGRALAGDHVDLRSAAAAAIRSRKEEGLDGLIFEALDDDNEAVRREALTTLLVIDHPQLSRALGSAHGDVRARVALARARHGDEAALEPLLTLATEARPEAADQVAAWRDRCLTALDGLAELAHPGAVAPLTKLLGHEDGSIRVKAAEALSWCSTPDDCAALQTALSSPEEAIRVEAAVGLATCGRADGLAVLPASEHPDRRLEAAITLGDHGLEALRGLLDHIARAFGRRALLALLLAELDAPSDSASRLLSGLAAERVELRIESARALESCLDAADFEAFVVELVRTRRDPDKPADIAVEDIRQLAAVISRGSPPLRRRAAALLSMLDVDTDTFKTAMIRFQSRFSDAIKALIARPAPAGERPGAAEVAQLVFGTWVGISRMSGGDAGHARSVIGAVKASRGMGAMRRTAVLRLIALAKADKGMAGMVKPVLVQALSDSVVSVRGAAYEGLVELGVDVVEVADVALTSGYNDIASRGLDLLVEKGGKAGLTRVKRVMIETAEGLESTAMQVLLERDDPIATLAAALDARAPDMRIRAVRELAARLVTEQEGEKAKEKTKETKETKESKAARKALHGALTSRREDVRRRAAAELSRVRDKAAFDTLVALLGHDDSEVRIEAIDGLARLDDARAVKALLARLGDEPDQPVTHKLLDAIGSFRDTSAVKPLLAVAPNAATDAAVYGALVRISGFDQPVLTSSGDPDWESKQRPRHDDVLVKVIDFCRARSLDKWLVGVLRGAAFARSKALDEPIASFMQHTDMAIRSVAIGSYGWRVKERGSDPEPLVEILEHPDPTTRFVAAACLANAGRKEGLSVLLSAVDLLDDIRLRRQALLSAGRLADDRVMDTLLRFVDEPGHALQDAAVEAIGHLSRGEKAEDVLAILLQKVKEDGSVGRAALSGLHHFGTDAARAEIRRRAEHEDWEVRQQVAKLLGEQDDEASRERLVTMIESDDDSDVVEEAVKGLRKRLGEDSLEPDYALICGEVPRVASAAVERLRERGDPGELLARLPRVSDGLFEQVVEALLSLSPAPIKAATELLASQAPARTLAVAAQLLGRTAKPAAAAKKAAVAGYQRVLGERESLAERVRRHNDWRDRERLETIDRALRMLIWLCGRLGCGDKELIALLDSDAPVEHRRQALLALSGGFGGRAAVKAMEAAVTDPDAELRALAAAALAELDAKAAKGAIEAALDDRGSLDRLMGAVEGKDKATESTLRGAASSIHRQGVALPWLIARGDVDGLAAVMKDAGLDDPTRLGAIEALARMGEESAEQALSAFHASIKRDDEDKEELRHAAWRGLKRSRRQRTQLQTRTAALPELPALTLPRGKA